MDIDFSTLDNGTRCVRLSGRLDSAGVDRVESRFIAATVAHGSNVVVDLSGVSFVASMGIRMFISAARSLKAKSARMALYGASDMVQSVFESVSLEQLIPLAGVQQDALALVSG